MIMPPGVTIRNFQPADQPSFESLNREWIETYFEMEPVDELVLQDPEQHILSQGGCILMAEYRNEVAGTVALKRVTPEIYEFTKMAVNHKFRGLRIGEALGEAAIRRAIELGASSIVLYSNTRLIPAISLYHKLGFKPIPLDGPYKRSDIKMSLKIS